MMYIHMRSRLICLQTFFQCSSNFSTLEFAVTLTMDDEDSNSLISICYCNIRHTHIRLPSWLGASTPILTGGSIHLAVNLAALEHTRDDLIQAMEGIKLKKTRMAHTMRGDYSSCVWVRYVDVESDDPINDPTSFAAKVFETRFRTPWGFFQGQLLP